MSLVWVNVMRLKSSQRYQVLYSAREKEFRQLETIASREEVQLKSSECDFLNKFSLMIQNKMQEGGLRAMCDFCDTGYATRELSKQTVTPFSEVHTMCSSDVNLSDIRKYGRPKLTFHDQIWSCCSAEKCFESYERAIIKDTQKMSNEFMYYRRPTKLSQCLVCDVNHGAFKCSRCQVAVYCSKECQRAAWPMHKRVCERC